MKASSTHVCSSCGAKTGTIALQTATTVPATIMIVATAVSHAIS